MAGNPPPGAGRFGLLGVNEPNHGVRVHWHFKVGVEPPLVSATRNVYPVIPIVLSEARATRL